MPRFRLALVVGVIVVIAAVWASGLRPWDYVAGRQPTEDPEVAVARGRPVVRAIYEYHADCGLWPSCLEDLCPRFATERAVAGWFYRWDPEGDWTFQCPPRPGDWAVRYSPTGKERKGWCIISEGVDEAPLKLEQPLPPPGKPPLPGVIQKEIERRIVAQPRRIAHYQGLVNLHLKQKDYDAARDVCSACIGKRPDHWWPHVMLAEVEARGGRTDEAEAGLRRWVRKVDDFPHNYLLAEFLLRHGASDKARVALTEATKHPLSHFGPINDSETLLFGATHFASLGSYMASKAGWWDLALATCDRWEEYFREHLRTVDPGFLSARAATYLAKKEYDKAANQANLAREEIEDKNFNRNYDWTDSFSQLEAAITARDEKFRWYSLPKVQPGPFPLFVPYQ